MYHLPCQWFPFTFRMKFNGFLVHAEWNWISSWIDDDLYVIAPTYLSALISLLCPLIHNDETTLSFCLSVEYAISIFRYLHLESLRIFPSALHMVLTYMSFRFVFISQLLHAVFSDFIFQSRASSPFNVLLSYPDWKYTIYSSFSSIDCRFLESRNFFSFVLTRSFIMDDILYL